MFQKKYLGLIAAAGAIALVPNCAGSSDSDPAAEVSAWAASYADGFAISSPTAATTTNLQLSEDGAKQLDPTAPASEKADDLKEIAEATTVAGCKIKLPNFPGLGNRATCYGPQIAYQTHPQGGSGVRVRPSGDLGFYDSQETDGTACAAAQMNTLMGGAAAYVDAALAIQAASICVLNTNSVALPDEDASADFMTALNTALGTGTGIPVFTTATVKNEGTAGYLYTFVGTGDSKAFKITIRHKAGDTENSAYTGTIYGYFDRSNRESFSVVYSKTGDDVKARMGAGSWAASTAETDMFDDSGLIKMGGSFHGNMNHAIINANMSTGVASLSYAWQAGAMDSRTRTFNVYTKAATDGSLEGCGFFGYGAKLVATTASNTNAIQGMICNWAVPQNSGGETSDTHATQITAMANKAQKQCFTQTSGKFVKVAAKTKITYWPTNSCDKGSFALSSTAPTDPMDANARRTAQDVVTSETTNDLVTTTSDTDFAAYTAPTAP